MNVTDLRPDIAGEIRDALRGRAHGLTADEIQNIVRRRRIAVRQVIAQMLNAGSLRAQTVRGQARDTVVYHLVENPVQQQGADTLSGCDRILARLQQGPATHHELYQLHCIVHSRISNLRKRGHRIDCNKSGRDANGKRVYTYTLLTEQAAAEAA